MGDCLPCPTHATTLGLAATSLADCICDASYFLTTDTDGKAICEACPLPGTACDEPGVTLATLPLALQYWRSSSSSTDPRLCRTYSNVEGEKRCLGGNATCSGLLSGVYCTACPDETYLDSSGECLSCKGLSAASVAVVIAFVVATTVLLAVLLCSGTTSRKLWSSTPVRRVSALCEASGLAAKAKQLVSFYQAATSVQSAFGVTFPEEVRAVLSVFQLFSLNLFELGLPIKCMGLGSFLHRLGFMIVTPLFLLVCTLVAAWLLLRQEGSPHQIESDEHKEDTQAESRGKNTKQHGVPAVLLRALPMALRLLFVVFPLVSAVAVQAYDCEGFDDGTYWLRADLSLQCGSENEFTDEYVSVRWAALIAILLYTVGVVRHRK